MQKACPSASNNSCYFETVCLFLIWFIKINLQKKIFLAAAGLLDRVMVWTNNRAKHTNTD